MQREVLRVRLVGLGLQSLEIEPLLAPGFDQPFALPQQQLAAFDDDGQLGQRPFDLGHVT